MNSGVLSVHSPAATRYISSDGWGRSASFCLCWCFSQDLLSIRPSQHLCCHVRTFMRGPRNFFPLNFNENPRPRQHPDTRHRRYQVRPDIDATKCAQTSTLPSAPRHRRYQLRQLVASMSGVWVLSRSWVLAKVEWEKILGPRMNRPK